MIRPPYDAIVPAGGAATRLGGITKPGVDIGGRRIIDRVLEALAGAARIVVVGDDVPLPDGVVTTRDPEPGCGPAGAVAAGLERVTSVVVVLVAADMPFVTRALIERLATDVRDDGAIAVGRDGQPQWLLSAWRTDALRSAALRPSASLRAALQPLEWQPTPVDAVELVDCDTPDDVLRARELAR